MILASKSPRRKEILETQGFNFRIVVPNIDESSDKAGVVEQIIDIAQKKAAAVAELNRDEYVVAADTVVVIDDKVLGKPGNRDRAREMLETLSGRTHQVITAYAFKNVEKNIQFADAVVTDVKFRKLDDETIEWYLETGEPMDKAGAYGIQEKGAILVEKIMGDFFSVMGFPISDFINQLKNLGIALEDIPKL